MRKARRQLRDAYRFPGFVPATEKHGVVGDFGGNGHVEAVPERDRPMQDCR